MQVSHFLLMVAYAFIVSLFLAVLWRRRPIEQLKLFLQLFAAMAGGALLLAYLMYPFPTGPPAPIP